MNIYSKLQEVKNTFLLANVKKTGLNKHTGFVYYELSDIMPIVISEFNKIGLCSYFNFDNDFATLTIVDTEHVEDTIIITSPMREANIPNCTPMQNLGGIETYQRRYLYTAALDIIEHDMLDEVLGAPVPHKGNAKKTKELNDMTEEEETLVEETREAIINGVKVTALISLAKSKGMTEKQLDAACQKNFKQGLTNITEQDNLKLLGVLNGLKDKEPKLV